MKLTVKEKLIIAKEHGDKGFQNHINIEAKAIIKHQDELSNFKITLKGMLQIFVNQKVPSDILAKIFAETLAN